MYSDVMNSQSKQNISGMPTLLVDDSCIECGQGITPSIKDVLAVLTDIKTRVDNSSLSRLNISAFKEKSNTFQSLAFNASTCLLAYQGLLDSMDSWLGDVSTSLSSSSDSVDISAAANVYSNTVERYLALRWGYTNYLQGDSPQVLVNFVDQFYESQLSLDDIDSSVFSSLTSIIDSLEISLKGAYHELFAQFTKLNDHMNETDQVIENFLRGRVIWRYPYVNVDSEQVSQLSIHVP
jgi:hypothetical protein